VKKAVNKHFKPEFLTRLDDLVIFRTLDKPSLRQIVDLEVSKLQARLVAKKVEIILDEAAKDLIVEKGFLPEMGARPLRRAIEQLLEDPLAEKILQFPNAEKKYLVSAKEGVIVFSEATVDAPQVLA